MLSEGFVSKGTAVRFIAVVAALASACSGTPIQKPDQTTKARGGSHAQIEQMAQIEVLEGSRIVVTVPDLMTGFLGPEARLGGRDPGVLEVPINVHRLEVHY